MSNLEKNLFLGIDIGASAVKIALLSREKGGRLKLLKTVYEEYGSSSDAGPQYQASVLEYILKKFLRQEKKLKNVKTGISIAGQSAFVRLVNIPVTAPKKLRQIVLYEIQQQIPFPMNDVVWGYQVYGRDKKQLNVLLAAVKKEFVMSILRVAEDCALDVEFMDVCNLSLYNCLHYYYPDLKDTLILDCGAKTTTIIVSDSRKIWTRSLPIGGEDITEAIAASLNVDRFAAEKMKIEKGKILMLYYGREKQQAEIEEKAAEAITNVLTDLTNEVVNTLNFCRSQDKTEFNLRKVLLTGGVSKIENIDKFFENSLALKVEKIDYFDALSVHPDVNVGLNEFLGASIGSALRGMRRFVVNINLLPEEQLQIKSFKKKRPFIIASAGFLFLMLFVCNIFIFNKYFLNQGYVNEAAEQVFQYERSEKRQKQLEEVGAGYENTVALMSETFQRKYVAVLTIGYIAAVMPETIWIDSLEADWNGGSIGLRGFCSGDLEDVGLFQESLNGKDEFKEVQIGTVGKDDTGIINFSLALKLKKAINNEGE
ncbi:MAG: pilus assembly protein PilM [PVC group bacterium]|nr:pilus assembly protein PilM [PVC group bacterium]